MRRLLIVDLEATCWDRAEHDSLRMETIEIGALLVDPADATRVREFQAFVRPVRFPELSAFCTALTSITQADVDGAETFGPVFARFVDWIGAPAEVRLCSWGDYDRRQLIRDCEAHGVAYPLAPDHLNLKHLCSAALGLRPFGLQRALDVAGLAFEGLHHRGLDDARNITRLLMHTHGRSLRELADGGTPSAPPH